MLSATRIRIFPTDEQCQTLAMQFGCARFVYNRALAMKRAAWKESQESLSRYMLQSLLPQWKQELPWLKDADSQVLQSVLLNLDRAFQNFFEKRARYPKPKKKHHEQSIQYPQRVKLEAARIYLPKVGWVDAKVHREIQGTIKTVTVRKTATGKYFASVLTENGESLPEPIQHFEKVEALDLGLSRFATVSTGEVIDNPRFLKNASRNLRRKQKKLSSKKKGSANRTKARLKVAKAHERVANTRNNFHHQHSTRLVRENQAIIAEDLAVKNMVKNHCLAKAISDAGWSQFVRFLAYKLERKGGRLIKVSRFFPSSKTCHACDHRLEELPLSIRVWTCPSCNTVHDRDFNATLTLKHQGILQLKAEGHTVSACGGLRKTLERERQPAKQEVMGVNPRSQRL